MIDAFVDSTMTAPAILQITISSDELSDEDETSTVQNQDLEARTSDQELMMDGAMLDEENMVSYGNLINSSPLNQGENDPDSEESQVDSGTQTQETPLVENRPSDPPELTTPRADTADKSRLPDTQLREHDTTKNAADPPIMESSNKASKTPLPQASPSPRAKNAVSSTSDDDSDDTISVLSGFPHHRYRDVPHFIVDDRLKFHKRRRSHPRRSPPYLQPKKVHRPRSTSHQSTRKSSSIARGSSKRRSESPKEFISNRSCQFESAKPPSYQNSTSQKSSIPSLSNRSRHDQSFKSQSTQRSRSPRYSSRRSSPRPNHRSSQHPNTSQRPTSSSRIPSLLNMSIDRPAHVSQEVVKWLRHTSRSGCWNCNERGHQFSDCPHPKSEDRKFCHRCGDLIPKRSRCRNCFLTDNL